MEQNKKTQGPESMKAPKSPTDMIIAPDVLSGALNAGRLSGVVVYLSLCEEKGDKVRRLGVKPWNILARPAHPGVLDSEAAPFESIYSGGWGLSTAPGEAVLRLLIPGRGKRIEEGKASDE